MHRVPQSGLRIALGLVFALALSPTRGLAQDQPSWVPPYPGPVPTSWPSVLQYEQYAQTRAQQLGARQEGLLSAGRSEHYQLQRTALFTTLLLGAGMATTGLLLFMSRTSEDQEAQRGSRAITGLILGGSGLTLVSGVGLHSLRRRNPYNEEIEHLRQEQLYWRREVKRVRRERKRGFDLSFTGFGLYASF